MGTSSQGRRWLNGLFSIVLVVAFVSLSACKTGSSDEPNKGWITIESPTTSSTYSINTSKETIDLGGSSFYIRTTCYSGFNCNTGVSITWRNLSTGQSGTGTSIANVCWLSNYFVCGARWKASPAIKPGTNSIEVKATSGSDSGTARIMIYRSDSQPPVITSFSPADGSTNVALDTTIVVNFNESIDPLSVSSTTFRVVDGLGNPVSGTAAPTANFITFTPDTALIGSTSYTVTTGIGIKDLAGNRISTDSSATFTTELLAWSSFNMRTNALSGIKAVWTGTKILTWGGDDLFNSQHGYVYDPANDSDFQISSVDSPRGTTGTTIIWSGSEMIAWGGYITPCAYTCADVYYDTGGRYDPDTNTWVPTSLTNAPTARAQHSAVWTGSKMIVWGGKDENGIALNTGGVYDPATDTWTTTSTINAPAGGANLGVWTGSEMIIWRGTAGGARYNPTLDTWTPVTTTNAPTTLTAFALVWSGTEMIVWYDGGSGARYNPATDTWTPMSTVNVPEMRSESTATWTGREMLIWGGHRTDRIDPYTTKKLYLNSMGLYNPATDSWRNLPTQNTPLGRYRHAATWTGTQFVIMGGLVEDGDGNNYTDGTTYTAGKIRLYP